MSNQIDFVKFLLQKTTFIPLCKCRRGSNQSSLKTRTSQASPAAYTASPTSNILHRKDLSVGTGIMQPWRSPILPLQLRFFFFQRRQCGSFRLNHADWFPAGRQSHAEGREARGIMQTGFRVASRVMQREGRLGESCSQAPQWQAEGGGGGGAGQM